MPACRTLRASSGSAPRMAWSAMTATSSYRYAYSRGVGGLPGNFIRADRRGRASRSVDRDQGRGARALESGDAIASPSIRHDPADAALARERCHRAPCSWMRGAASGSAERCRHRRARSRIGPLRAFPSRSGGPELARATTRSSRSPLTAPGRSGSGTAAGLERWQPERGAFAHFRHDESDPASLAGNQVSQVDRGPRTAVCGSALSTAASSRMDHGRSGHRELPARSQASRLRSRATRCAPFSRTTRATCGSGHRRASICSIDQPDDSLIIITTTAISGSLRDSYILSLYQDTAGLVWIGTREGGVSRWNPRSWELGGHRPDWLAGKLVMSFADAPGGKVWIASMGGGLVRFDDATGEAVDIDAHRRAPQRHRRSARDVAALGS